MACDLETAEAVCPQVPTAPPPPPLPELHRQLGPLFTFASGSRAPQYPGAQGLQQQQQQQNTFNFEAAALLALEYRSLVEKTRQRQMAELQAALSNGTTSGWKTVRLLGTQTETTGCRPSHGNLKPRFALSGIDESCGHGLDTLW